MKYLDKCIYNSLEEHIQNLNQKSELVLYADIETLKTNCIEGRQKKSKYIPVVWSVAVKFRINEKLTGLQIFKSFDELFKIVFETKKYKRVKFVFHNGNKFDNHFLETALEEYCDSRAISEKMSKRNSNKNLPTAKTATALKKRRNYILEKRIKAKTYVELKGKINNIKFITEDTVPKFKQTLANIGEILHRLNLLPKKYLKTSMKYDKYDTQLSFKSEKAKDNYINFIWKHISKSEVTYIENDVHLLMSAVENYSTIFPGFDYDNITLTKSIADYYTNYSKLSSFQILARYKDESDETMHLDFAKYNTPSGVNMYSELKRFYRGGLNFYNDKYLEKFISNCFSVDINSSYPSVMYGRKLPTFIESVEYNKTIEFKHDEDHAYFYKLSIVEVNKIIKRIPSINIRKMVVKYYNTTSEFVYLNSELMQLIRKYMPRKFTFECAEVITFKCEYFDGRQLIFENYKLKTELSVMKKESMAMTMSDPYTYVKEKAKEIYKVSEEDISVAKLKLNGLYGLPALRAHFNMFQYNTMGELENIVNGFDNMTRNLPFAVFVTACAFRNLISPMIENLTPSEIDDCFVYADTDSLYLKRKVMDKFPESMFDKYKLGAWDIENEHIFNIWVQNHKKYAYETKKGISVRAGGIKKENIKELIKSSKDFKTLCKNHLSTGSKVANVKSQLTESRTVVIHDSESILTAGKKYYSEFSSAMITERNLAIEVMREMVLEHMPNEFIYAEHETGTISKEDLFHVEESGNYDFDMLLAIQNEIKGEILNA